MGWRISFGVGPLRYSAPLTSRRRRTVRYASPSYARQPREERRSPGQIKSDRIATLIGFAIIVGAIVAVVMVGLLAS